MINEEIKFVLGNKLPESCCSYIYYYDETCVASRLETGFALAFTDDIKDAESWKYYKDSDKQRNRIYKKYGIYFDIIEFKCSYQLEVKIYEEE